jgi:hypothetical protein
MGKTIAESRRFDRMRTKTKALLMPDTCKIKRITLSDNYYEISETGAMYPLTGGVANETSGYITYEGSEDIPCRVQESRFLRNQQVFGQETVINQFEFFVPIDVDLQADDLIVIDGREFQLLTIMDNSEWLEANRCFIAEVRTDD